MIGFPKPVKAPPKARKPIAKVSAKRAAKRKAEALAFVRKAKAIKAKRPSKVFVKQTKAEKEATEFARTHHSVERAAFVQSLPCCGCGVIGYSENAHVGNEGAGKGRKANYDQIAPLCSPRSRPSQVPPLRGGCHALSHRIGQQTFEEIQSVNLAECMAETQRAWLASSEYAAWLARQKV